MTIEIYAGGHHGDQENVEAYGCWDDCVHYRANIGYEIDGCGWYYNAESSWFY